MHHLTLLTVLFLLAVPCGVYSGNILVIPVDGSHWINMKVLITELHSKGHNITVIRSSNSQYIKESSYFKFITVDVGELDDDFFANFVSHLLRLVQQHQKSSWGKFIIFMEGLKKFSEIHKKICNMTSKIFESETMMKSLQQAKFDMVLADPVMGGGVLLAHKLGLPLVFNVRWTTFGEGHFAIAPSPLSYVPVPGAELTDKMSFTERVKNVLTYLFNYYQGTYVGQPYQAFCQKYFGPDVDYFSLLQNADIWLMRNDFTFEFPRPTMPNVVYMGGFQCKPSKPLPDNLEKFVQSSGKHGVIIMSLGTLLGHLEINIADEIAAAFAQLPQKVIWRHTGPRPYTLGNNTLLVDWMPQNDLLGHTKTKVFVAHGGTNGIQEAIYHGVPIVGLPIAFDQPDNLSRMRAKGTARVLDISELDRSVFLEALKEVLYNPSYREKMQKFSRLHHDQPIKPLEQAVFWIEYVIRNGGAPQLRTHSFRMSWITYHSVDVLLTILGAVLISVWITFLLLRCLCFKVIFNKKLKRE